jgi:hypothetical protein
MLSSAFQDKITRNMSILHSILKTIYLCGKQNISLRGHTEEKSNCIALINYRAETDQILATHLQNSPPNARYLSSTMQNELIDICGRQLQVIVSECNSANCFSVIADETTDVRPYLQPHHNLGLSLLVLQFGILLILSLVVELASANARNDSLTHISSSLSTPT